MMEHVAREALVQVSRLDHCPHGHASHSQLYTCTCCSVTGCCVHSSLHTQGLQGRQCLQPHKHAQLPAGANSAIRNGA
jgi:hypothetical protein